MRSRAIETVRDDEAGEVVAGEESAISERSRSRVVGNQSHGYDRSSAPRGQQQAKQQADEARSPYGCTAPPGW